MSTVSDRSRPQSDEQAPILDRAQSYEQAEWIKRQAERAKQWDDAYSRLQECVEEIWPEINPGDRDDLAVRLLCSLREMKARARRREERAAARKNRTAK